LREIIFLPDAHHVTDGDTRLFLTDQKNHNTMKRNLGDYDIAIRIIGGLCLTILFVVNDMDSPLNWILFPLSGMLLITGLSGSCPFYRLLHIDTRGSRRSNTSSH
jgi:hypothetical protein